MFYLYLAPLSEHWGIFNVFKYLTFRAGGAILTAMLICFIFGPMIIKKLQSKQKRGQPIRSDGPEGHIIEKAGTPTMGGFMILLGLFVSTLLWADLSNPYVWCCLFVTLAFGVIGFIDDYIKVSKHSSDGLSGKIKFIAECAVIAVMAYWLADYNSPTLSVPFFKDLVINMGIFYVPFIVLFIVGMGNAVNLTDGLDGLAIMPVIIAAGAFALITYLVGHALFADYLNIIRVEGAGELTIFCAAIIGAGLGFLWFNAPPAMVFMGDTGSLALGGALGTVAAIAKHEIVLLIVGGLFVLETASVIVQVLSFKLTGKRVFRMAPIHHHYEKKGWAEPTIVIRFWIIAVILALIGLASLKLR